LNLDDIRALFIQHGNLAYSGEPVSQLEHALQSAALAEAEGASDELIAAAFLHDLGHLLNRQGESPTERGLDDVHQYFALPFLRSVLPEAVLEPIRLHVDAKRCLCAIDDTYFRRLSPDSVRSLQLQGGVFSHDDAQIFLSKPFAEDALRLRRWDDRAKEANKTTPDVEYFLSLVERVMKKQASARGSV
jgi:phosphonate degradation associated HDIG domain protein